MELAPFCAREKKKNMKGYNPERDKLLLLSASHSHLLLQNLLKSFQTEKDLFGDFYFAALIQVKASLISRILQQKNPKTTTSRQSLCRGEGDLLSVETETH